MNKTNPDNDIIKPTTITLDVSRCEGSFDLFCPLCGEDIPLFGDASSEYCSHIAFVRGGSDDETYLSDALKEKKKDDNDDDETLRDILENGCDEFLLICNIESSGIACGPVSESWVYAVSFRDLEDFGVYVYG